MTSSGGEFSGRLRPEAQHKFRAAAVEAVLRQEARALLGQVAYDSSLALQWTQQLCDSVRLRLKEMNMPRYKFVVHGVIGEQRGEGAKVAARCLWDSDTDALARDVFVTESLFCVLTAYGVYYY